MKINKILMRKCQHCGVPCKWEDYQDNGRTRWRLLTAKNKPHLCSEYKAYRNKKIKDYIPKVDESVKPRSSETIKKDKARFNKVYADIFRDDDLVKLIEKPLV